MAINGSNRETEFNRNELRQFVMRERVWKGQAEIIRNQRKVIRCLIKNINNAIEIEDEDVVGLIAHYMEEPLLIENNETGGLELLEMHLLDIVYPRCEECGERDIEICDLEQWQ